MIFDYRKRYDNFFLNIYGYFGLMVSNYLSDYW